MHPNPPAHPPFQALPPIGLVLRPLTEVRVTVNERVGNTLTPWRIALVPKES